MDVSSAPLPSPTFNLLHAHLFHSHLPPNTPHSHCLPPLSCHLQDPNSAQYVFFFTATDMCLDGGNAPTTSFTALGMCGGSEQFEYLCGGGNQPPALSPPPYAPSFPGQESCAMLVQVRGRWHAGGLPRAGGVGYIICPAANRRLNPERQIHKFFGAFVP